MDIICSSMGLPWTGFMLVLYKAMETSSLPCHLHVWEVEMSLFSEACYCCGELGQSVWPLNAQMTPREKQGPLFLAAHL